MKDILLYVAIALGIVFLVLVIIAITNKDKEMPKWLGPLGGLVAGIAAALALTSGGGNKSALDKIKAENKRLEKELAELGERSKKLDAEHEKEKAAYEAQLAELQTQLDAKETERQELEKKLQDMANLSPMEWLKTLKADEIAKIKEEINKDIDWI